MMIDDDRDLYDSFAAVRREEEAQVVPISIRSLTPNERRREKISGRLVAVTALLAVTIAVAMWLRPWSGKPNEDVSRGRGQLADSITTWKPSTDFLLDTPGREMLQGVPAIGDRNGAVLAPRSYGKRRQFSQPVLQ